jgi:hypothetical protein
MQAWTSIAECRCIKFDLTSVSATLRPSVLAFSSVVAVGDRTGEDAIQLQYQSDAVFASRTVSQPGERTHSLIPLREDFLCARGESVLAPFAF